VVATLFGLSRPGLAVFGEKDYQQLVLVRRMNRDLCLGVRVVGVPTVRQPDGLALSSRNRYLDPGDRRRAAALARALEAAQANAGRGAAGARAAAAAELAAESIDVDYLEIRTPDLGPVPPTAEPLDARILVAASVGTTRLIDNAPLRLGRT
jgi:pantoate--beta-alanine ligase